MAGPTSSSRRSGESATVELAIEALPLGGTAVLVGLTPFEARASFAVYPLVDGSRRILGSNYGFADPAIDFPRYAALHLDGRLPIDRLIDRRIASTTSRPRSTGCATAKASARSWSSTEPARGPSPRSGRARRIRRPPDASRPAPSARGPAARAPRSAAEARRPVISRVPRPWVKKVHAQRTRTTIRLAKPIR